MTKQLPKLFTTKGCTQCQALKPHLEREGVEVEVIDAQENREAAMEYEVGGVPTIILPDGTRYTGGGNCMRYVMVDSKAEAE